MRRLLLPGGGKSFAVTCDLEGTLLDLERLHFAGWQEVLCQHQISMSVEQITSLPGFVGGGDRFIADAFAGMFHIQAEVLLLGKKEHFESALRACDVRARPGVIESLGWLLSRGCLLAIGSLTPRAAGMNLLERSGLLPLFEPHRIVFREDVSEPKPHPAVYYETAKRLGIESNDMLVFEDSPAGIRAAVAAGCKVVAMPPPLFHAEDWLAGLRALGAAHVLKCWTEFELPSEL